MSELKNYIDKKIVVIEQEKNELTRELESLYLMLAEYTTAIGAMKLSEEKHASALAEAELANSSFYSEIDIDLTKLRYSIKDVEKSKNNIEVEIGLHQSRLQKIVNGIIDIEKELK